MAHLNCIPSGVRQLFSLLYCMGPWSSCQPVAPHKWPLYWRSCSVARSCYADDMVLTASAEWGVARTTNGTGLPEGESKPLQTGKRILYHWATWEAHHQCILMPIKMNKWIALLLLKVKIFVPNKIRFPHFHREMICSHRSCCLLKPTSWSNLSGQIHYQPFWSE